MLGPDAEKQDHGEHSRTATDDRPQEASNKISSFDLLQRVILGLIQAVGQGAELVSASLAEELAGFRLDLEHRVVVILLVSAGFLLLSIGVLLFLSELMGSWTLALFTVGAVHVGVGLWLSVRWKRPGDSK